MRELLRTFWQETTARSNSRRFSSIVACLATCCTAWQYVANWCKVSRCGERWLQKAVESWPDVVLDSLCAR
jgi:hypothetical protein